MMKNKDLIYIKPNWPAPKHVKAFTTTKSCFWNFDQSTLVNVLSLPREPIWLKQTHSAIVVPAYPENQGKEADASFTFEAAQVCMITTADCLPILICNTLGTQVGAIHAGWRGLSKGIINNTIQDLQTKPGQTLVWLGPAIGPGRFEVGPDVFDQMVQNYPSTHKAFVRIGQNKWLANLYQIAKIQLNLLGIFNIFGSSFCTYTQSHLFFSYRRDKNDCSRMASLIWIEAN